MKNLKAMQTFNYFAYSTIIKEIEDQKMTVATLSKKTGINPRTLYNILVDEDKFEKTSFHNVQLILIALKISEAQIVNDYYRDMYGLGEDNYRIVAIRNTLEGCIRFELTEKDFLLVVEFLKRLSLKHEDDMHYPD